MGNDFLPLLGKGIYLSFYLSYLIFPLIFSLHIFFFIFSHILYLFIFLPKVTPRRLRSPKYKRQGKPSSVRTQEESAVRNIIAVIIGTFFSLTKLSYYSKETNNVTKQLLLNGECKYERYKKTIQHPSKKTKRRQYNMEINY